MDKREETIEVVNRIASEWYKLNEAFCKDENELSYKILQWIDGANENEKNVLLNLFQKSRYYSKKIINNTFLQFYNDLDDKGYTIFSAIESQEVRQNSSHMYLNEFAIISEVADYSISPMISSFKKEDMKYIKNIVFLDDIIGTGQTVIDFLDTILEQIRDKKIYIWVICITKEAIEKLNNYSTNNGIQLEVCQKSIEEKAFEEGYIFDIGDSKDNELLIFNLEKKLWKRKNTQFYLGKDNSQCLVSFYNDTPNNTLSSFWFFSELWNPIFNRKKKYVPPWLKEKKEERRKENYARKQQR